MRRGKTLLKKDVISAREGRKLGTVNDLYLGADLERLAGLYLGTEGLVRRTACMIPQSNVELLGEDVILVDEADAVRDTGQVPELALWTRGDALRGREVNTAGGTRIGLIDDVILDDEARVVGYTLSQVFVSGPVADKRAIARGAVTDFGHGGSPLIVDLAQVEQQELSLD